MIVLRFLGLVGFLAAVLTALFLVEWLRTLGPVVGFAVMGTIYLVAFLSARADYGR